MRLSVIIVNYNVKYFLEQCLYSVIKACRNIQAEIFVVDNHSTDGSREYLENKFPGVIFTWSPENSGFAKANNSALKKANGDFVLFLNPDTIIPEDCFEKCISFFHTNENCGALGVRMIDGSGNFLRESKRSFPTPAASFFKMTGFARLFPRSASFSKYYAGHLPEYQTSPVEVLAGAFFMVRKKTLDKTGSFDESFFMYAEDIDLSYRIQEAGFTNYYFPQTTIIHFKGESTQRKSRSYILRFYGAMQLFVKKHYSKKMLTKYLMTFAITFSKWLSLIKLFFSAKKHISSGKNETLVIAGQQYFNEMIQLIKYADDPILIQGRISQNNNERDAATGDISDIEMIVKKNNTDKILFCEEPLSFAMIISIMEKLKGRTGFLFHANNSESIVGSDDKNDRGIFIAKKDH